MTQDEKAKAYDEALERAKSKLHYPDKPCFVDVTEIFPELKEIEDERIRGAIIDYLTDNNLTEWAAWIEKQGEKPVVEMKTPEESLGIDSKTYNEIVDECIYGEQKPTNKIVPTFHEGDWVVVSTTNGDRVVQIASVEYLKDGHPSYITTEGKWFGNG